MNSPIVKMKEGDGRYKQISERFTNIEKKYENKIEEIKEAHVDRNQGKAVITGFI